MRRTLRAVFEVFGRVPGSRIAAVVCVTIALACSSDPATMDLGELPTAEELYVEGEELLEDGRTWFWVFDSRDYQGAIDKFQDIIDNYPYSEYAVLAELRIADTYFRQELYDEAVSYYRDFAELHPDHEKVPYTLLRAGLCYYHQSKGELRDQTATKKAIERFEVVLRLHPYSPEAAETEALWRELRTRLAGHVMEIGDFYMKRAEYQSAADRYRSLLNEYPGLGLDPEALYKLGVCYDEMNLGDEADRIFQVILDNYGDTELAEAAADYLPAEVQPAAN